MWRNWNIIPPVNNVSSDEGDYESPSNEDPDNLVSPNRPHQSPSASPRALLRPDPPPVDEVLADVGERLRALPNRQQRAENRDAVRRAQQQAEANRVNMPETEAQRVAREAAEAAAARAARLPYDQADTRDGEKAQDYARSIKIEYEPANIKFWFSQLEGEMLMATVGSQWLKKTILQRNLPNKQKMDVMSSLTLSQEEAGNHIYFDIKTELLRIYAQKPQDSYKVALTRTMTGLPSQLGHQIVQDICKKSKKLEGCCCDAATFALWSIQLPVNIRAHISNMTFNSTTYKDVFEQADKVYLSAKQISVAALAAQGGSGADLDETQAAFTAQNQPHEVAAIKGQSSKKKNKKNKNKNKGQTPRGPRHSSSPPESCCDRHYVHGPDAWYCLQPTTCPWANRITPKA